MRTFVGDADLSGQHHIVADLGAARDAGLRCDHRVPSEPARASTGKFEALELRDRDFKRYHGQGVLHALTHIREKIAPSIRGIAALNQADVDRQLIRPGWHAEQASAGRANAILGVSLVAVARAAATSVGLPLYRYWAA